MGEYESYIGLSDKAWAKTNMRNPEDHHWLSVLHHSMDVYKASNIIWDSYLNVPTKKLLANAIGSGEAAKSLSIFLASCHDVGKITPSFQSQGGWEYRERTENNFGLISDHIRSRDLRHEVSSAYSLQIFMDNVGIGIDIDSLISPVAGHHGIYGKTRLNELRNLFIEGENKDINYGNGIWEYSRQSLIKHFYDLCNIEEHYSIYSNSDFNKTVQSIIGGFIVLSDWTASNDFYFPLTPSGNDNRNKRDCIASSKIKIPSPWNVKGINRDNPENTFRERFGLPDESSMRPVQKIMYDITKDMDQPHLIILEAPMGVGKTEAALFAAESIADNSDQGGIIFAMPTMATTNGIFPRVSQWLNQSTTGKEGIVLKHSKAFLNDDFLKLKNSSSSIHDDENNVSVSGFFNGKKDILSPFVVSTIDNILFASLIHKHYSLRHLGLSGKIVIIDEVHAADSYMSSFLERSLTWLRSMGCTVILLSATLPAEKRQSLMDSYASLPKPKLSRKEKRMNRMRGIELADKTLDNKDTRYPLITTVSDTGVSKSYTAEDDSRNSEVLITLDENIEMDSFLDIMKGKDGNIAVIVNTVANAQKLYDKVCESGLFDEDEIFLFHSRFIAKDRSDKESELLSILGKGEHNRPKRSIVISTQVIEQSLDLDFDVMISEIAPIDLLLQRMGRLHRHDRDNRPTEFSKPQFIVTGFVENEKGSYQFNRGTQNIYSRFLPLRTLNILKDNLVINLPSDIPGLIYDVYSSNDLNNEEKEWKEKLIKKNNQKKNNADQWTLASPDSSYSKSLLGTNEIPGRGKNPDLKGSAVVRDTMDSIEVIVMRRIGDNVSFLHEDTLLSTEIVPDDHTVREILGQTVILPAQLTYPNVIDSTLDKLEEDGYIHAWQQDRRLAGEIIMFLDENNTYKFDNYILTYDNDRGIISRKLDA